MAISKAKIKYEQGVTDHDIIGSANLGVRASALQEINSQNINSQEWLNTASALFDGSGNALSSTAGALHVYLDDQNGDLDVNLTNATVAVTQSGSWTVAATQSGTWTIDSITNAVTIQDGGGSITVDGSVSITGDVNVTQGTSPWVVSAIDLDIRALDGVTIGDTVGIVDAAGDRLAINTDGSINVVVSESAGDGEIKNSAASVTTTAAEVLATPMAGRNEVLIYNNGDKSVFIGFDATVTAANGMPLPKYSSVAIRVDDNTNIFMIAESGTQDVRFLEIEY